MSVRDPWRRAYHCLRCGRHVQVYDLKMWYHCVTPGCPGTWADFVLIRRSGCPVCLQRSGPPNG